MENDKPIPPYMDMPNSQEIILQSLPKTKILQNEFLNMQRIEYQMFEPNVFVYKIWIGIETKCSSHLTSHPNFQFQSGQFSEDMIPTVGFNMRKITKGNVTIKVWDIGGQPRFRSMWERYCRGVNAIV